VLFQPARPDRLFWDCWLFYHDGQYHLFYQRKRAGEAQTFEVGHAISPDLVRWTEVAPAYVRGPAGAWDDGPLRTGTTLRKGDRFYLVNGAAEHRVDKLGVSTSTDLIHWEKYAGNPVSTPDPRWYEADAETCALGNVAWRDPCILPDGDSYIAFLCARLNHGPLSTRGTIATLHSRDLLHWEAGPPVQVPADFVMLEVPDVFALDGRWFLLHSTTPRFGVRITTCDPDLVAGTHVLWAEQRDGPYTRPPRDVLIGSSVELTSAWVCRTTESPLGRIAYYVNAYPEPLKGGRPRGIFGLPKGLAADARGLTLRYLPLLEPYRSAEIIPPLESTRRETRRELPGEWTVADGAATGQVAVGTSALPIAGEARDFILTATLTIARGRAAGLGFRLDLWGDGLGVIFDTVADTVAVVELATVSCGVVWRQLARRQVPLAPATPLPVRLVALRDVVEVFLADELLLSVVAEGRTEQGFALVADDAQVHVDALRVWPLDVPPPTDLTEEGSYS
jgi:beta-fructofuranosidase